MELLCENRGLRWLIMGAQPNSVTKRTRLDGFAFFGSLTHRGHSRVRYLITTLVIPTMLGGYQGRVLRMSSPPGLAPWRGKATATFHRHHHSALPAAPAASQPPSR